MHRLTVLKLVKNFNSLEIKNEKTINIIGPPLSGVGVYESFLYHLDYQNIKKFDNLWWKENKIIEVIIIIISVIFISC